jgi:hypothetical protein
VSSLSTPRSLNRRSKNRGIINDLYVSPFISLILNLVESTVKQTCRCCEDLYISTNLLLRIRCPADLHSRNKGFAVSHRDLSADNSDIRVAVDIFRVK